MAQHAAQPNPNPAAPGYLSHVTHVTCFRGLCITSCVAPDLPADYFCFQVISQTRTHQSSCLFVGPSGTQKDHLFARLGPVRCAVRLGAVIQGAFFCSLLHSDICTMVRLDSQVKPRSCMRALDAYLVKCARRCTCAPQCTRVCKSTSCGAAPSLLLPSE